LSWVKKVEEKTKPLRNIAGGVNSTGRARAELLTE